MIKALVTDLDNTLYSWVDYIVPSLEAMVSSLCQSTNLPRITVIQSLKKVYERYRSNEYPFVIQEAECFQAFAEDFGSFHQLVLEPARLAFKIARDRYLQLYPGVEPTLRALGERGIPVVGLTDAPRNPAELRVKHLGLDQGLLRAVYSMPAFPLPERVHRRILAKEREGRYRAEIEMKELPAELEKPNPGGLEQIVRELGLRPGEVLFVGDSKKKDVAVAQRVGCVDAWAEYGTYRSAEYSERLEAISAPSATKRHVAQDGDDSRLPTHRLAGFDQVLGIIEASQLRKSRRAS